MKHQAPSGMFYDRFYLKAKTHSANFALYPNAVCTAALWRIGEDKAAKKGQDYLKAHLDYVDEYEKVCVPFVLGLEHPPWFLNFDPYLHYRLYTAYNFVGFPRYENETAEMLPRIQKEDGSFAAYYKGWRSACDFAMTPSVAQAANILWEYGKKEAARKAMKWLESLPSPMPWVWPDETWGTNQRRMLYALGKLGKRNPKLDFVGKSPTWALQFAVDAELRME